MARYPWTEPLKSLQLVVTICYPYQALADICTSKGSLARDQTSKSLCRDPGTEGDCNRQARKVARMKRRGQISSSIQTAREVHLGAGV